MRHNHVSITTCRWKFWQDAREGSASPDDCKHLNWLWQAIPQSLQLKTSVKLAVKKAAAEARAASRHRTILEVSTEEYEQRCTMAIKSRVENSFFGLDTININIHGHHKRKTGKGYDWLRLWLDTDSNPSIHTGIHKLVSFHQFDTLFDLATINPPYESSPMLSTSLLGLNYLRWSSSF